MKKVLSLICILLLLLELFFIEKMRIETPMLTESRIHPNQTAAATTPAPELLPAAAVTARPAETAPAPTPEVTPEPTPEPQKEFIITCLGDCTLWSNDNYQYHPAGFAGVMGDNYAYPFSNTVDYFTNDEFTIANCECILTDNPNLPSDYTWATFAFRAPTEYAEVFNEGGVDFVTTANNHMMDCYQAGADSTYAALEAHGVPFGREGEAQIVETPNGFKLGIYCSGTDMAPNKNKAVAAVQQLVADLFACPMAEMSPSGKRTITIVKPEELLK